MSVNNMIFFLVGRFNDTSNLSINITMYLLENVKFRDKSSIIALGLWQFSPFKHTNAIFSHLSAKKAKAEVNVHFPTPKVKQTKFEMYHCAPFTGLSFSIKRLEHWLWLHAGRLWCWVAFSIWIGSWDEAKTYFFHVKLPSGGYCPFLTKWARKLIGVLC